jgi:hypothetical protein
MSDAAMLAVLVPLFVVAVLSAMILAGRLKDEVADDLAARGVPRPAEVVFAVCSCGGWVTPQDGWRCPACGQVRTAGRRRRR